MMRTIIQMKRIMRRTMSNRIMIKKKQQMLPMNNKEYYNFKLNL